MHPPPVLGPPEEPNGEGITFATDSSGYFTISEGSQPPLHFFRKMAAQIAREEAIIVVRYSGGKLEESADLLSWREVHAGGGEFRPSGNTTMRFYRVPEL